MEKDYLKNAYDMGEGIVLLHEPGQSFTLVNTETGKVRQLVSADGRLLVSDNEIDEEAMAEGCPDYGGKYVEYWFGRYCDYKNGVCAIGWTVYPDGRYFEDEDGFGSEKNSEETAYCIINRDLEIIVPFQPMDDVREMLKKYGK